MLLKKEGGLRTSHAATKHDALTAPAPTVLLLDASISHMRVARQHKDPQAIKVRSKPCELTCASDRKSVV